MEFRSLAIAAAFLTCSSASVRSEGLRDGSFEKPQVRSGTQQFLTPGQTIGPWQVCGPDAVSVELDSAP